jgi:hypothetical protein
MRVRIDDVVLDADLPRVRLAEGEFVTISPLVVSCISLPAVSTTTM